MNGTLFSFTALLIFFSCGNKDVPIPKNILPQAKMQQVMWDVMRADELVSYQFSIDSNVNQKQKSFQLYGQVFRIHKVSEQDFKRSFTYYQKNPGQLKVMLDSLRNRPAHTFTAKSLKPH